MVAILVLVALVASGSRGRAVVVPAIVVAAETFSVTSEDPGHFSWTLSSGRAPTGAGLIQRSALEVDRSELTILSVPSTITSGQHVERDAIVAELGSEHAGHLLDELRAERDAIQAERALLLAGGRPEAITAAERAVAVAQAVNEEDHATYVRLAQLAGTGAISADGLRQAELRDASGARAVELARAQVAASRVPARPEELSRVDARIGRVDAQIAEVESRVAGQRVRTPISGIAEVGGSALIRIDNVDRVYVLAAIPESMRARVSLNAPIEFSTPSLPRHMFPGRIAEISPSVALDSLGQSSFYVSAEVANPAHDLRTGMLGAIDVMDDGWDGRLLAVAQKTFGP